MTDLAPSPSADLPDVQPDLLDGRYEILACVGAGGMGVIHKARDHRLDREVAIKRLREDLRGNAQAIRRFTDEAKIAATIDHPNAVTVHDSGVIGEDPYMVMELLPGRRLSDELSEGPVSTERAREIARGLLGALEEAHRCGIVHRDIKPSNVLIGWNNEPMLADFGIAKSDEDLDRTCTSDIIGTAAYVAPERIEGRPATPQADIYAVGVVLYEALTGQRPHDADTPIGVLNSIANHDPRPIDELREIADRDLVGLVAQAMAKSPEARFASAGVMLAALDGRTVERIVSSQTPIDPTDQTVSLTQTMIFPMAGASSAIDPAPMDPGSVPDPSPLPEPAPFPEPSRPFPEPTPQPSPVRPEPSPPVPGPTPEPSPVQPEPSPPIPNPLPTVGRPNRLTIAVSAFALLTVAWMAEPDARNLANLDNVTPAYAQDAEPPPPAEAEPPPQTPPVDEPAATAEPAPAPAKPGKGNGKKK